MTILKMMRVTMHPWVWWVIVKRALVNFRGEKQGLDLRRKIASIIKTFDDRMDPDDSVLECPYARLLSEEVRLRNLRNAEIKAECEARQDGSDPRQVSDVIEGGRVVKAGWKPVPKPELRVSIDYSKEEVSIIKSAIEAYAEGPIPHDQDMGFVDAVEALESAAMVEIDTEAHRPAKLHVVDPVHIGSEV